MEVRVARSNTYESPGLRSAALGQSPGAYNALTKSATMAKTPAALRERRRQALSSPLPDIRSVTSFACI